MKRWKRTKSSYFSVLLRSFAIFTLLLVVVAVVLLFWALQDSSRTVISLSDRDLSEYDSLLESGKYDQFPTRTLLGRTGSIAVVDENGTVLFPTRSVPIFPRKSSPAFLCKGSISTPRSPTGTMNRAAR